MRKANFWRDWRRWHAGRAVRGQGNLALKFQPDLAPFKYFDQGWLAVIGRWGVWGSSLRAPCLDRVGLHSRDQPRNLPESIFGFLSVGDPRVDLQSWSAA